MRRELASPRWRRGGDWGCTRCLSVHEARAGCGQRRRVVSCDRHGQPRCQNCPDTGGDPVEATTRLVVGLDPAVSRQAVEAALGRATVRPAGRRRLAWAILDRPDLLTGSGADAPHRRCSASSTNSPRPGPRPDDSRATVDQVAGPATGLLYRFDVKMGSYVVHVGSRGPPAGKNCGGSL